MLYTNWIEQLDPNYRDEEMDFFVTMIGFLEKIIYTLEEMRLLAKHEIERKQYLD